MTASYFGYIRLKLKSSRVATVKTKLATAH